MPTHVVDATVYRADPTGPKKRWIGGPIAEADQVAVLDDQPKVSQPFRFAGGSTINDFVPGNIYWLLGVATDGRRAWMLTLQEVRPAGRDVMLVCKAS
jgi:hypothetical protein